MLFYLAEPSALVGLLVAFVVGVYVRDTAQVLTARVLDVTHQFTPRRVAAPFKERFGPFSAVAFLICGAGWGEPILMNDRFRKQRFRVAAAILAGPLAYLLLTLLSVTALAAFADAWYVDSDGRSFDVITFAVDSGELGFGGKVLAFMTVTFGVLFVTSLIPVPPTDGGRVLFLLAPQTPGWHKAHLRMTESNWGIGILLALLLLPVLIGFPSVTGQLAPPLAESLGDLVGLPYA